MTSFMARAELLLRTVPLALLVVAGVAVARQQPRVRRRVLASALLYLLLGSAAFVAVQAAAPDYFWTAVFLAGDFRPGSPTVREAVLAFPLEHLGVAFAVALFVAGSWSFDNKGGTAAFAVATPAAVTLVTYAPFWWRIAAYDHFRHSPWLDPPGAGLILTADFAPPVLAAVAVVLLFWPRGQVPRARNAG